LMFLEDHLAIPLQADRENGKEIVDGFLSRDTG
jgi:hypothetical protein